MKMTFRLLCLATPLLSLLAACSSKPQEVEAGKTAVVVPADAASVSDTTAVQPDSAK